MKEKTYEYNMIPSLFTAIKCTIMLTLSRSVDFRSTSITATIMDSFPSKIIKKKVQNQLIVDILTISLQATTFENLSRFTLLEAGNEVKPLFTLLEA